MKEIDRMADIYLIYGREDEAVAAELVQHLKARWSVWWDKLIKEKYTKEIPVEISKAKCAIVLWSEKSSTKDTVVDEVRLAKKQSLTIVSATLDGCDLPYPFGGYSTTPLQDWDGTPDHPQYQALFSRLTDILPSPKPPNRPSGLESGRVPLPTLFLSVSSFETHLLPDQAVKALTIARAPAILISAWDLVKRRKPKKLIDALFEYQKTGGFILLDSGNYESSRLSTKYWDVEDLNYAMSVAPHDWAFCFDKRPSFQTKKSKEIGSIVEDIVLGVKRDQEFTAAPVFPVVHVPRTKSSGYQFEKIPEVSRLVAEALRPELIGIPERELGAGIRQRIATMKEIRRQLSTLPFYQPVHLLGTGNPWTVATMVAAGADTFDGLEWCRTVVDQQHDRLNHFQHFDLFTYQTELADLAVARDALEDDKVDFAGKVAFHNLDYFLQFGDKLREAVSKGRLEGFVSARLGKAAAEMLQDAIPGIFD